MNSARSRRPLVGRSKLRQSLRAALSEHQTTVLLGPPGVGKTALALDVELEWHEKSRVVGLSCAKTVSDAYRAIAGVLEPSLSLGPRPSAAIGQVIRAQGVGLLCLDNLEQLGVAGTELVRDLAQELDASPCILLVTSRRRVELAESFHLAVPPLTNDAAAELFFARLAIEDRDRYEAADATADIVARLDGLPLAVELAAARASLLDPDELLGQVAQSHKSLASRWRDRSPRHRSLYASVEWSWRLLNIVEQRAMFACALLADGFRLDSAAELLARTDALSADDALAQLETLLNRSWIHRTDEGFFVLSILREFAIHRAEEHCDISRAFVTMFAERADVLAHKSDSDGSAYRALIESRTDILNALRLEASSSDASTTTLRKLLHAAKVLAIYQGPIDSLKESLEICVDHFDGSPDTLWYGLQVAVAKQLAGERDESLERLRVLVSNSVGSNDRLALEIRQRLGHLLALSGRLQEAEEILTETLTSDYEGPDGEMGRSHAWLGIVAIQRGQGTRARAHLEEASRLFGELGDRRSQCTQRHHLGMAYLVDGHFRDAERVFRAVIESAKEFANRLTEVCATANLGSALHFQQNYDDAATHYSAAARQATEHGIGDLVGEIQLHAAILELECGEHARAVELAEEARTRLEHSLRPERELCEALLAVLVALEGSAQCAFRIVEGLEAAEYSDDARRAATRFAKIGVVAIAGEQPVREGEWSAQMTMVTGTPLRLLGRAMQSALHRRGLLSAFNPNPKRLVVHHEGHWFMVTGTPRRDFGRRSPVRRLLKALLRARIDQPGKPIEANDLIAQVWPGEFVALHAAKNRLRVSVRKIRKLGLEGVLIQKDGGYFLDPRVPISEIH